MDSKIIAEQIFLAAIKSVLPDKMVSREVRLQERTLNISGMVMPLDAIHSIYVIGAGKASAIMATEIENILGNRITGGHVVVKYGHTSKLKRIQISEAGHPEPDNNGYLATQKILAIARLATDKDLIICLISGGGSALLTDFPEGENINDIIITNDLLLKCGADIRDINTVRKHLSKVKGGQLAQSAYPATLVTLILSDVIGDFPDTIASGPTVPDPTTFSDAIGVLRKYKLIKKIPPAILDYLKKGVEGVHPETPKIGDPVFENTYNVVIGSNKIALEAARKRAVELDLHAIIITSGLEGDTIKVADQLVATAIKFQNDPATKNPCCLLFGGETTLSVNGNGSGGRNQHMALYVATLLKDKEGITFLSAGTDGNDGPTSAAGAIVDTKTFKNASVQKLGIDRYLKEFDSFHFFEKAGGHVITGPTMTNVMDLIIIIIE
jgi:glycerate 2-kinase